jgi:hypothetical protein
MQSDSLALACPFVLCVEVERKPDRCRAELLSGRACVANSRRALPLLIKRDLERREAFFPVLAGCHLDPNSQMCRPTLLQPSRRSNHSNRNVPVRSLLQQQHHNRWGSSFFLFELNIRGLVLEVSSAA